MGAAARTWEIDDEGYLYFGLTITCTLPRDVPGINFSLSHGTIRKGTPLTITLPATMLSDLSDLGRQIDSTQVLLDGGQIYSGTGPTSPSCTINDDAGQYTVTVILNTSKTGASDPISYSGDFQLTVQQ